MAKRPIDKRAIARGVSVYQGDIDQGLADYPDQAFDYVILSQTLQPGTVLALSGHHIPHLGHRPRDCRCLRR